MSAGMRAVVAGALLGLLSAAPAAAATCEPSTELSRLQMADYVFDGVAEAGDADPSGHLLDPATFAVRTWHKHPQGSAPDTVKVATFVRRHEDDSMSGTPGMPNPRAEETWRIYGYMDDGVITDNGCMGSHRLSSLSEPLPFTGPGTSFTVALAIMTGGVGLRRARNR